MAFWLDVLRAALPPNGVLLVGAGAGDGPWVQWLQSRGVASENVRVHLVEADEKQYRHLQESLFDGVGWALRRDVVVASTGRVSFHHASNPTESGLLDPETLKPLWPHLCTEQTIVVDDAVTLDSLAEEAEGPINWLMLDCLPAGGLLRGGDNMLTKLDVALVRVAGSVLPAELLAGEHTTDDLLRAAGLRCIHVQPERHPALAHALYVRDSGRRAEVQAQKLLEQLKAAEENWAKEKAELRRAAEVAAQAARVAEQGNAAAQRQAHELREQLKVTQQTSARASAELTLIRETADKKVRAAEQAKLAALEDARQVHEQLKFAQDGWVKERAELGRATKAAEQKAHAAEQAAALAQKQAQELGEKLKMAQEVWAKEAAKLTHAKEAAAQQAQSAEKAGAQALEQAHKLHDQHFETYQQSIKSLEKELRAAFGKDLGNAVKQIEAFVSIQNYLNTGDSISGFHGWPISPDVGLFLIERIRQRNHNLILEFGSGVSTALFAKVLQIQRRADLSRAPQDDSELSRPVCSFEHDQVYLRKTEDMLGSQRLTSLVNLSHAPLLDWHDDSGRYLYYDCASTLAALAQQLAGPPKRVLVLVDGPPGATCANARYPAVPEIFNHLARHEIDIVLDDASRPEEKAIIDLWRAFWKQRSIRVREGTVATEKGLYWARNYDL